MNQIRSLNIVGQGPFLTRSNTMYVKMMNLSKSIGVEIDYQNLPNIENFLINFN